MTFSFSASPVSSDVLFLLFHKGESLSRKLKASLGEKISKIVEARFQGKDFEGEEGQMLTLFPEGAPWKRVILVGQGEKDKEVPQAIEFLGGKLADAAKAAKASSLSVVVDAKNVSELGYGLILGAYEFKRYKTPDKKAVELNAVSFITTPNKKIQELRRSFEIFEKVSPPTRDLINTCAGDLDAQKIAELAQELGKKYKMKVTVFDQKKLEKLGLNALVGVGKGAKSGPCLVFLEYRYKTKAKAPSIAFLGKGITFDTGGLNLKPTGNIETMKQDMAGAATVLGTLQALAEGHVPGYFLGVLACAENALSDRAQHPGDVVKAYNGKTIEVNNTDAEGRMVLADALAYTEKNFKPKCMIDIATLTGAASVALGYQITAIMGTDQNLIRKVVSAAKKVHERLWPLPLDEDFVKQTKGDFSDLKNITDGVRAGVIMGAAFLKNFVEKTPWVHLDIGSTAWAEKPTSSTKYGATAAGLRTLIEVAKRY